MERNGYLHDLKFLIVDDSPFMREVLRRVLRHFDVSSIREAGDGAEALEIMQAWTPDIILLDWEMSPFNGLDFTRMVRASTRGNECFTPVIMVSAHAEYWRIQQARNSGVNEYLVKPVSPKSLFSRIRAVIERPRQFIKVPNYFGPDRRRQDLGIASERRQDTVHEPTMPAEQVMEQDQINAIFNPGSEHPDEQDTNPPHPEA